MLCFPAAPGHRLARRLSTGLLRMHRRTGSRRWQLAYCPVAGFCWLGGTRGARRGRLSNQPNARRGRLSNQPNARRAPCDAKGRVGGAARYGELAPRVTSDLRGYPEAHWGNTEAELARTGNYAKPAMHMASHIDNRLMYYGHCDKQNWSLNSRTRRASVSYIQRWNPPGMYTSNMYTPILHFSTRPSGASAGCEAARFEDQPRILSTAVALHLVAIQWHLGIEEIGDFLYGTCDCEKPDNRTPPPCGAEPV